MNDLDNKRHSLAHLLASAVLEKFPDAQLGVGPVIENGFYYDFLLPQPLTPEDLPQLEARMKELVQANLAFEREDKSFDDARKFFEEVNQPFKIKLINDLEKAAEVSSVSLYQTGKFIDLCRGGHVEKTSEIDPDSFILDRISGAYWRGNQENAQMQRIYGLAFDTKTDLDEYLAHRVEAEKRDHKRVGKEMGLFTFSSLVGPGLPLYMPNGSVVRTTLLQYITELKEKRGYSFVWTPHLAKEELYKQSGHLGKYDAMLPSINADGDKLVLKPMNCPHHFQIYNAEPKSYRDFPIRIAENATVYRNEKSGELNGLFRVRSLTQDDTHHFVRHDQIPSEIDMILQLTQEVYEKFGFKNYHVEISVRDQKNKDAYFGSDDLWETAEKALIEAVERWGVSYQIVEGEAAFYGPKIDIRVQDALGRTWQLTTLQLDYNQPENFDMQYVANDGTKQRPAVLHVAILGSIDRFMGILIEQFAGAFPIWLHPTQVAVLPISEKQNEYAQSIIANLKEAVPNLRITADGRNESIGKRIREQSKMKVPYILVVGDKELQTKTIAIRGRNDEDLGTIPITDFIAKIKQEIETRK